MSVYRYATTELTSGVIKGDWLPLVPMNFSRNINATGTFTGALNLTAGNTPAEPAGEGLQLAHGRRFPDIEEAEEGQGGQVALPVQGAGAGEGDPQAHDLVHHDDRSEERRVGK